MDISKDNRVVLTLDAGGTNFVFSALQKGRPVIDEITLDSNAHNLERCVETLKSGFHQAIGAIEGKPEAISFAFPGPADYPRGIIGDLNNLPAFRGGVPLKAILEEEFSLPVFINNDGDLYAYGEALGGILPEINKKLEASGSPKRYHNLVGLTLGTGFGGGIVRNGELFVGDNSTAGEVWLFSNRMHPTTNAEDVVSIRAVKRYYAKHAGITDPAELEPKDIYEIAAGQKEGNREAAKKAYHDLGRALGDTVANLLTLIDGIVVIGGGLTGASELYMPAVMEELKANFFPADKKKLPRLVQRVFNLDNETDRKAFYKDYSKDLAVAGTDRVVTYDPIPRLAITTSRIGASRAIFLGAYAYALNQI